MKKNNLIFAVLILLAAFIPLKGIDALTEKPTILEAIVLKEEVGEKIIVNGLAPKNSSVLIYINGSYNGLANISDNDPELNNFSYTSSSINIGGSEKYEIFAIARNLETMELSAPAQTNTSATIKERHAEKTDTTKKNSEEIKKDASKENNNDKKESKLTLLSPTGTIKTNLPIISGRGTFGQKIRIFVDNSSVADITITNTVKEGANFSFQTTQKLEDGLHFVYATVIDDNDNANKQSNLLSFIVQSDKVYGEKIKNEENKIETITAEIGSSTKETTGSTTKKDSVFQKIGPTFNLSLLIIFVIGALLWVIILKIEDQKKEETEEKAEEEKK